MKVGNKVVFKLHSPSGYVAKCIDIKPFVLIITVRKCIVVRGREYHAPRL